jgi:hypothetical protein
MQAHGKIHVFGPKYVWYSLSTSYLTSKQPIKHIVHKRDILICPVHNVYCHGYYSIYLFPWICVTTSFQSPYIT